MVKGPTIAEQELAEAQSKVESLTQLVSAYAAELEGCRKLILGKTMSISQPTRRR